MKFLKYKLVPLFALIILTGTIAVDVSAQDVADEKPGKEDQVIVHYYYDPFSEWDRWWYDPYENDPYLRERRAMFYRREAVRDARGVLNEHLMEYNEDGVITADERRELNDDRSELNEARADLREYRIDQGYVDYP